ncbi:hypothetical protein B5X24_HaOG213781 [Helicoverpa armigera]|nr:hypothetical protein B5X24_HaOG213781 [Helicoverpa armigera]
MKPVYFLGIFARDVENSKHCPVKYYDAKRLVDASRDQKAGYYLGQRISMAIQRGNATSLLGTLPVDSDGDEFFDAF